MTISTDELRKLLADATQGPWSIRKTVNMSITCRVHQVTCPELFPSAFVPAWDRPAPGEQDGTEEALANARLIAAAPDLADEVIRLRGLLKSVLDVDASVGTRSTVHDIARVALNHKETE